MPRNRQQLDLAVVGMARSGTTLLSGLLTDVPAGRVCMPEPRLYTKRAYRDHYRTRFESLGMTDVRVPRDVLSHIADFQRFSIKEVRAGHIKRLYRHFDVRQTVIIVRDARACLLSYQTRRSANGSTRERFSPKLFVRTQRVILRLVDSIPKERFRVVRYESFVSDPDERETLASWLDWPLAGNVVDQHRALGRAHETATHGGAVSPNSIGRGDSLLSAQQHRKLGPMLAKLAPFQAYFGYPLEFRRAPMDES